ncbi:MAG: CcmD family protein [Bacteroidota bacterium]
MESLYEFFENNSLYIVLFIVVVIWSGIFMFLMSVEKRLRMIEKQLRLDKSSDIIDNGEKHI